MNTDYNTDKQVVTSESEVQISQLTTTPYIPGGSGNYGSGLGTVVPDKNVDGGNEISVKVPEPSVRLGLRDSFPDRSRNAARTDYS